MDEARLKILKMLEEGKITADEAAKLLEALDKSSQKTETTRSKSEQPSRQRLFGFGDMLFEIGEIVRESVTAALSTVPSAIRAAMSGSISEEVDEAMEVEDGTPISLMLSAGDVNIECKESNQLVIHGDIVPEGLDINEQGGGIAIKVSGGDLDMEVPQSSPLDVSVTAGDLDIRDVSSDLKLSVSAGDVDVSFAKVANVDVFVKAGDISIKVPSDADFEAEIDLKMGDLRVPSGVSVTRSGGKHIIRFGTGTGGKLTATVKFGDMKISFA